MASRIILSNAEIMEGLNETIIFIIQASAEYDKGMAASGKKIAVEMRKLFHQTGQSHSILGQLGLLGEQFFSSVKTVLDDSYLNWCDLINDTIYIQKGKTFPVGKKIIPVRGNLLETGAVKNYSEWWENEVILRDWNKKEFTRKELVTKIANQDNGAHLDPGIDADYYDLTRNNSMGIRIGIQKESGDKLTWEGDKDVHLAIMRQIAHEVLYSLSQIPLLKDNVYLQSYIELCK